MGRLGPAFLAYQNFQVYLQWNNSLVYSTTAAYLATRIAGAPALRHGTPPPALAFKDMKELQTMLVRAGFDVGKVDGFPGLKTRQAVKAMQMKYGLPADSYPTAELLARMRSGNISMSRRKAGFLRSSSFTCYRKFTHLKLFC